MRRILDIEKIERVRYDLRIAKTEFCKTHKINIRTYNALIKDPGRKTKDETILKIAKALDLNPSELILFSA